MSASAHPACSNADSGDLSLFLGQADGTFQELPRILFVLEPDDEIVRPAHDDHVTVRVAASPPFDPQVEDVV